jgi:hypothetical protein
VTLHGWHPPHPRRPGLAEAPRFIGIGDVRFVLIGPSTGPAEPVRAARETAHRRLAREFLTRRRGARAD